MPRDSIDSSPLPSRAHKGDYDPNTPGDWPTPPTNVGDGLDAAALRVIEAHYVLLASGSAISF